MTQPVEQATFTNVGNGQSISVHFNPNSLTYNLSNTIENTGSGNSSRQQGPNHSGKLTMELVFDSTDTGQDVRLVTFQLAELVRVGGDGAASNAVAVVEFAWGNLTFRGSVKSFDETMDFFSSSGIPLRATVKLEMVEISISPPPAP